jgi:two-component system, NarL family, sensor histidine kinase YdfH
MQTNPSASSLKLEKDLRWFLWILTLVVAVMYSVVLVTVPTVRKPTTLIIFTVLVMVYLFLHWFQVRIAVRPSWVAWYIIIQGILFFAISNLSGSANMIFPLFSGLIGGAIGMLGFNRRGILAEAYYLALLSISFLLLFSQNAAGWLIVVTVSVLIFTNTFVVLYQRQIKARAQAQTLLLDLGAANRQLSEYAARIEDLTTAAERQRMARELHDTLSQGLAGLILQLEAMEAHLLGKRPERALRIVQEVKARARETLAESRQAIADLRQAGPLDLGEAARQEAEHFTSFTGIPCAVEIALPAALPDPVTETAIRVISEGLTNVARHARAKSAKLRIATIEAKDELEIEICDDGIGFDPVSVGTGHYGLLGMRERVHLAGDRLEVRSEPEKGTQIVIRFPLEDSVHE